MNIVKLRSQISGKSIDELFDYQSPEKINQSFTIENSRSFYKNNEYLESKQLDLNETFNPILFGNEYLFSIEKIPSNNEQKYYFVSKSNFPSLKLSYHNYRLYPNIKDRESPTWISLYNFNYEINEIKDKNIMDQKIKKNKNLFLKNKKSCYELNIGDVIKLGRVSLIITKIHLQKTKKVNNEGNNDNNDINLNKKLNDKNKTNNNKVIKDIYQEYHYKAVNNKIIIDKNLLKKFTFNSNEQTLNNNLNNNEANSFKHGSILINEDNNENKHDINKSFSDKNNPIFINEESSTSKVNINSDKKKLNSTYTNLGLKEKINYNNSNNGPPYDNKSSSEKSNICRICYCDEIEMNSPLLNLCNCLGCVKYIHLSCLSHWFKTKSKLLYYSNNICKQLCFNKINCEICKEKFPEIVFNINKKKTYQVYKPDDIVPSLNNIFNNYIIFESFELFNQKKLIYIISFDEKNTITIGRGQDSDVRLTDVTVSRIHSMILRTNENKIMIKDAGSKFGTLILLQTKKIIISNKILSLQIGKLYLNLYIQNYSLNCLFRILCSIFCFCYKKKKNQNKIIDKKSSINFSYNNKFKNEYLNESNFNMMNINNFIYRNDINFFDYNIINKNSISIEDIIDAKFQIDEINQVYENNKSNDITQIVNKLSTIDKNNQKNMSVIESFNNLNMVS